MIEPKEVRRYTFRKKERLKLRRDITLLFKEGKSVQNEYFVIIYRKNGLDYSRIAISVKKKFGKANRRNKLRRWVRECFRTNKYNISKGFDFLIIARKNLSEKFDKADYRSICSSLLNVFERIIDAESNT
ncbi:MULTISPECIES: ribonuclease P protein component [Fervidobacterium]|uniref:Ribonuclease P protein component n=1 Tax=Fervidobacterium nodosum (strain ATCC 35602 / DSM 5306 / Rt17-B1) TaxID=381764 RepID=A7HLV6_FERNB|nr:MULTISPECIES: ribonuclease P protein component [Fervidobacterium]ABS60889.1 ribonuclease P protein component [Fervidobacterium nodosum Rt17-B1]HOJ94676.1 ribonuclease P protein component [Fervidobacterium nodosum]